MYTRCPECRTWFRVTDEQLSAASARVRCGQCLASFDASTRLWSDPDDQSPPVPWKADRNEPPARRAAAAEPEAAADFTDPYLPDDAFEPLEHDYSTAERPLDDESLIASVSLDEVDIEVDLEAEPTGPLVGDVRKVAAGGTSVRPGADRIHEGRVSTRRRRSREQAILNRIEGMDIRRGRRLAANSCIALLLLVVLQYAWFMAGELSAAFPALGPALEEFCAVAGCETKRAWDDKGIRVVSRTVRPHPEYASAFSVRATLENRAPEARPYPVVVFVLYGQDGRTLASRAFEPAEYLEGGAAPDRGLESGSRADIAFDLVVPSEVAVSFDLRLI